VAPSEKSDDLLAEGDDARRVWGRRAFALTVILTVVYLLLDLLAQLLPPHYSAIAQAESDLAVGPYGYVMTINFVVRGILSLGFVLGLAWTTGLGSRARVGLGLLAFWGLGAFLLAAFPTDVPSTPVSWHGAIHLVVAALAFLAASIGELLLALHFSREPALRRLARVATGIAVLGVVVNLVLFAIDGRPHLAAEIGGLAERLFLGIVLAWMVLVSLWILRAPGSRPGDGKPTPAASPT
jgi:hypothetical membrane protein